MGSMSDLEPIVGKKDDNPVDPSKKTMDKATLKKHLIIITSIFAGVALLCTSVAVAGALLTPPAAEPTIQKDARAAYYDEEHRPIETTTFAYGDDQDGTGYLITSISAPTDGSAFALVLPQYDQSSLEVPARYVTGVGSLKKGTNIFGKNPTDFSLSRVVFSGFTSYIGAYSFSGVSGLTTIQGAFSSESLRIMNHAFAASVNLSSFPFPASVSYIGDEAFAGCALTEVDLSASSISQIGSRAFANNVELTSISIPATLTEWGEALFENCPATSIRYAGTKEQFSRLDRTMVEKALQGSSVSTVVFADDTILEL